MRLATACLVPIFDDGEWKFVALRDTKGRGVILPGGKVDADDESIDDGAVRELYEETGLIAKIKSLFFKMHVDGFASYIYLVTETDGVMHERTREGEVFLATEHELRTQSHYNYGPLFDRYRKWESSPAAANTFVEI